MAKKQSAKSPPFTEGQSYFIRTVTYHCVGRVVAVFGARKSGNGMGAFVQLTDASWVADSGRFAQAIKDGTLNEVEPVGAMYVAIASVVDVFPWVHVLPTQQK
jgi:hypothetical protein